MRLYASASRSNQASALARHISTPTAPICSIRPRVRGVSSSLQAPDAPPGDVLDQVVAALELGNDPQHRQQEPQVACQRRLQGQLLVDQPLDVPVQRVDQVVALHQGPGHLAVARQQGVGRRGQPLADQGEQLDDLAVDLVQVPVVLSRSSSAMSALGQ